MSVTLTAAPPRRRARAGAMPHAALIGAHLGVAWAIFALALCLGLFQMLHRSGLLAGFANDRLYYASVTAHGVGMAYLFTTFFAMGLGYFVLGTDRGTADDPGAGGGTKLFGEAVAWPAFAATLFGGLLTSSPIVTGDASVLYTFYPPLRAHPAFYAGLLLVLAGSWTWAVLMIASAVRRRREIKAQHGPALLPLPMFAVAIMGVVWLWASAGMAVELVIQLLPSGTARSVADAGLARTLYSWTLHAIVYFWLTPAYLAFYALFPRACGGRLFSDEAARIAFVLILLFSLPVGFHHLYADPEHGSAIKLLHAVLTFVVIAPTLLTIFTVTASAEVGARLRGGRGTLGWVRALPWGEPMALAGVLALVLLGLGGMSGIVNASYGVNAMIHNTAWVPAHFHLILGGATVILYFGTSYAILPAITGRRLATRRLATGQVAGWAFGIAAMTLPWHVLGLLGQPRRWARYDLDTAQSLAWQPWMTATSIGGVLAFAAGILFVVILMRSLRAEPLPPDLVFQWAAPLKRPNPHPLMDSILLWNGVIAVLMALAYGPALVQAFAEAPALVVPGWTP